MYFIFHFDSDFSGEDATNLVTLFSQIYSPIFYPTLSIKDNYDGTVALSVRPLVETNTLSKVTAQVQDLMSYMPMNSLIEWSSTYDLTS